MSNTLLRRYVVVNLTNNQFHTYCTLTSFTKSVNRATMYDNFSAADRARTHARSAAPCGVIVIKEIVVRVGRPSELRTVR